MIKSLSDFVSSLKTILMDNFFGNVLARSVSEIARIAISDK